ncbi:winged helix-turn-helix domain-containing protein [Bradyrhizobium sp. Pear77]|uniref:winged helix-turn-helix domain-containing tetratricopeptide repeat protein n=1 Tax=Bradyrhizobium altum TaxID=1571202 RepID=UPI001E4B9EA1|nr:winged helix-turn-helix domain-containing protein [Bradyrhizobium altum]MCC8952848.1 winged helix-turn-helix domain-containing protein [Bradyrhizobium altum]
MNPEIGTKTKPSAADGDEPPPIRRGVLHFADFDVDLERAELRVRGTVVALRPKSFALLVYLACHPGRLLTKDELIETVWPDVSVTDDSLVQCISELRAALGDGDQRLIKTIPRRGYLLDAPPVDAPPTDETVERGAGAVDSHSPSPRLPPRRGSLWWLPAFATVCSVSLAGALWFGFPHRGQYDAFVSKNTITVLPLVGVGGENAADLAEAVTEDLTIEVSRLPDTLVIGHLPEDSPARADSDAQNVGRRLDVAYVLGGSLHRQGEAVSIAMKLQASATGALLWSGRFDYAEQAGWNWRRDVTARIANELKVRIDEAARPFDRPYAGRTFAAIDPTLQGWRLLKRIHTREEPQRARALFELALQIDPDSASALAGLALSHITEVLTRWSKAPGTQTALAAQAIERSLALQPNDPRANYVRSLVLSAQGRIDDAEQAIQRVLSLYPNQPRALQRLGFLRLQQGRPEEVVAPVMLSLRLDPLDAEQVSLGHFTLGMAEFHLHHDEAAYAHMRQAMISSPQNGFAWQWLAAIDALHGRSEQARNNLIEYQKRIPGSTVSSLKASEPSRNAAFWQERNRFYEGLRKAGLPE